MLIKEKTAKFITAILFVPLVFLVFASESDLLPNILAASLIMLLMTVVSILGVLSNKSAPERIEISRVTLKQDKDIYIQVLFCLTLIFISSYKYALNNAKIYLLFSIFILLVIVFKIWLRALHKQA